MPAKRIDRAIYALRGQKVILDRDLAKLYGVETRAINQAVRRNSERFPEDFMFVLTRPEIHALAKMTGEKGLSRVPNVFAFTEQGVAMLSSVLRSSRAVQVNIEIMRTFVRLRQWLASNAELTARLARLEKNYDRKFKVVFEAIRELMRDTKAPRHKREIGFHTIQAPPGGKSDTKALTRSFLA